jgi:hypothetical protein
MASKMESGGPTNTRGTKACGWVAEGELVVDFQGDRVVSSNAHTQAVAGHVRQKRWKPSHSLLGGQSREVWLVWRWSKRVSMEVVFFAGGQELGHNHTGALVGSG